MQISDVVDGEPSPCPPTPPPRIPLPLLWRPTGLAVPHAEAIIHVCVRTNHAVFVPCPPSRALISSLKMKTSFPFEWEASRILGKHLNRPVHTDGDGGEGGLIYEY